VGSFKIRTEMCSGESVSLGHEVFAEVTCTHFEPRAAAVKWVRLRSSHPRMLLNEAVWAKPGRLDGTVQNDTDWASDRTGALACDTFSLNDPHFTDVFALPWTYFMSL